MPSYTHLSAKRHFSLVSCNKMLITNKLDIPLVYRIIKNSALFVLYVYGKANYKNIITGKFEYQRKF